MATIETKKILRLIGLVGKYLIRERLKSCTDEGQSGLRIRFDNLEGDVLASCMNEIASDKECYGEHLGIDGVEILLPRVLVDETVIRNKKILYDGNAAAARNQSTDKRILLFANGFDAQLGSSAQIEDTLKEISPIDANELLRTATFWIEGLSEIYPQIDNSKQLKSQLAALFDGFRKSMKRGLKTTSRYLLRLTDELLDVGIQAAASNALTELSLPHYLRAMPKRTQVDSSDSWEKAFSEVKKIPFDVFSQHERPVSLSLSTLVSNYQQIKEEETIDQKALDIYESLSKGEGSWDDLLELDWITDRLDRFVSEKEAPTSRKALGIETLDYFEANRLDKMDNPIAGAGLTIREFLEDFASNDKKKNDDEFKKIARLFYKNAEIEIDSPKLRAQWEKLLFSDPIEGDDFVDCILQATCKLIHLHKNKTELKNPVLLVSCQTPAQDIFTDINFRALQFFSTMYKGLESDCAGFVQFYFKRFNLKTTGGFNPLFHFDEAKNAHQKYRNSAYGKSLKKESLQIKFIAYLVERSEVESITGGKLDRKASVRITWGFPKDGVAMGFARDIEAVAPKKGRMTDKALNIIIGKNFRQTNSRGLFNEITLKDTSTFGFCNACFVDRNSNLNRNLKDCFESLLSSQKVALAGINLTDIRDKWNAFLDSYGEALSDFHKRGLCSSSFALLNGRYSALLSSVAEAAKRSDEFGRPALSILLSIGIFSFVDEKTAYAVATPWNPMRLFDLHRGFVTKLTLAKALLENPETVPVDEEDFVRLLAKRSNSLEPSLVVVPRHGITDDNTDEQFRCDEMLSPVENVSGYTLYSRIAGKNCRSLGTDAAALTEFADVVVNNYLKLMPEATNSLRILLPDVDSKELPLKVAQTLVEQIDSNENISISAGGIATEKGKYLPDTEAKIYSGLVDITSRTEGIRTESLLSPSLRSRLELRVIPARNQDLLQSGNDDVRTYDIALLDRFITGEAKARWVELPRMEVRSNPYGLFGALQAPVKRVFLKGREFTSTTLLCSSDLSDSAHTYLYALRLLVDKDSKSAVSLEGNFYYPCLEVDCDDSEISKEIKYLHDVARWVVTSNDLIDRRQLLKSGIKIVRYKRNAKTGKTSIVSSSAPTRMLIRRIRDRLVEIAQEMSEQTASEVARAILDTSYRISGFVALRSAKRESSANEVMGLALSHWITRSEALELCESAGEQLIATASFLLDDYASIFKSNHRLADLLRLTLSERDGRLKLHVLVIETKFRSGQNLSADKVTSAEQAKATADVFYDALSADSSASAFKPLWLSRLATFVMNIEAQDALPHESAVIVRLSEKVKRGEFDLSINAVSHIFVHDVEGDPEYVCLDDNITGRKLSQIVLYEQSVAKLLKKGEELSFAEISKVMSNTDYAPHFDEVSLVKDWQWADGLSLDLLVRAPSTSASTSTAEVEKPVDHNGSDSTSGSLDGKPRAACLKVGESESTATASARNKANEGEKALETDAPSDEAQIFAPSFANLVKERGGNFAYSHEREAWAQKATLSLRTFLITHGIPARVKQSTVTPNGCLVCFEGDENLTTKNIEKHEEILLSTKGIKVLHAVPAVGEFQILFNDGSDNREAVSLWKAWSQREVKRQNGLNLSFIIGLKESDGKLLYLDPDRFEPHTLIAGGTGSGKTALVQTLILDMAATNPSTKLKFYLIDPKKGVDFAPIQRLPHLAAEPVTELADIPKLFNELYKIMEDRYDKFNAVGANKLSTYNAKVPREKQLPALFVIHDELAFCMQNEDYKKTVPPLMIQLATKCRAAGIYLVFIAQRPDKDVVPIQVRDNLGNRLILKVPAGTSEFALGEKGAENLLGKGHMAAKLGGKDGFEYVQVPFLSDRNEVLEEVAEAIRKADKEWR